MCRISRNNLLFSIYDLKISRNISLSVYNQQKILRMEKPKFNKKSPTNFGKMCVEAVNRPAANIATSYIDSLKA